MAQSRLPNVNQTVTFAQGQVPDIIKKLEQFFNVALSLRSNSGEVVVKTDYFYGPCCILRGTERGRVRCRKTYKNIEDRLLRRKVPFVNICYAGFLVFAVPLDFRGEMVGTLLGSQILPMRVNSKFELEAFFGHTLAALGIQDEDAFYRSFSRVKTMQPDFQRLSFMQFLQQIGDHFTNMAYTGKTWDEFFKEMKSQARGFGKF